MAATKTKTYTVRMGQGWYEELRARCAEVGTVTAGVRWDDETTTTCRVKVRFKGTASALRRALGFECWLEVR